MEHHKVFKLVFSSSCTVYGEPETLPITEGKDTGKVTSVYGRTKYFNEEILKDLSLANDVSDRRYHTSSNQGLTISHSLTELEHNLAEVLQPSGRPQKRIDR
jgi:UDP-glucose 4-epimerase